MRKWGEKEYKTLEEGIKRADMTIIKLIKKRITELETKLAHERVITIAQRDWIKQNKGIYTDPELFTDE